VTTIAAAHPSPWRTTTVRQCASALAWTLGLTAVFAAWYAIEKWGLRLDDDRRLVRSAPRAPMIALGIPHFLIGFLFLVTSRRVSGPRSVATLVGLVALGVGLCALYTAAGAHRAANKLPTAAVALYFIVHELRDEGFFFRAYGDAPKDVEPARTARFLRAGTAILVAALGAIAVFAYDLYADAKGRAGPLDYVVPGLGTGGRAVLVFGAMLAYAGLRWFAWARREPEGLRAWAGRTRPMGAVLALFLGVVLLGGVSRALLEAIVLWHVVEWLVFSVHQAGRREREAPPPTTWLGRAKGTRSGFLRLHLGLSAVVFVLLLVWTYGTASSASSPLWFLVSHEAFFYWTIMHVTLSFYPR
jgi:hypothetical protein